MIRIYSRLLFFVLPLIFVLLPAPARALGPSGDVYLGYSRLGPNTFSSNADEWASLLGNTSFRISGMNGLQASGHLHLMPFLGVEADVAHYGFGAPSTAPHSTTFMVGPRVTVGAAGIHLFAHGLVGGEHSTYAAGQVVAVILPSPPPSNFFKANAFVVAAGGGVDFRIFPFFSWRVTGDYIDAPTHPSALSHNRFGTGLVFRF